VLVPTERGTWFSFPNWCSQLCGSTWVPFDWCFSKRNEIQRKLLYYTNSWAISRMEETSSPWNCSKIDCPCGQCLSDMAKLVENLLMTAEMIRVSDLAYSTELVSLYFYLFSYLKQVITGQLVSNTEELLSRIEAIWDRTEKSTLITILGVNRKARLIYWHRRRVHRVAYQKYRKSIPFKSAVLETLTRAWDILCLFNKAFSYLIAPSACFSTSFLISSMNFLIYVE
jgi:hypothetical protein